MMHKTLPHLPPQPGSTFLGALSNSFSILHQYCSCDYSREFVMHYLTPLDKEGESRGPASPVSCTITGTQHYLDMGEVWYSHRPASDLCPRRAGC